MLKYIIAFILLIQSTALAMPPILPFSEITKDMTGTAYTVVDPDGTIKNFNVRIIGTINNGGKGTPKFIMARASGDLVNSTGGVLQGMSGSPVYVNGKLIGALSAGFKNLDPYIFLITPIEKMLEIWNLPDSYNPNPYAKKSEDETDENSDEDKISDEDKTEENSVEENSTAEKFSVETEKPVEVEEINKAAIVYNGFESGGLKYLKTLLAEYNFDDFSLASSETTPQVKYDAQLSGGSSVGVYLICGDFTLGSTGTVTLVEGQKILGFGHSFSHGGNVNYFMTDAKVIGTVSGSIDGGIKIPNIGSIIGRINQDRESGIGGIIGQFPATVPIGVTINNDNYNALIAYNESLMPKLGAAVAYGALNKSVDSNAEGTVKINFEIKTDAVEGGVMSRENLYYSNEDVGQVAVTELMTALNLISNNTISESNIFGIDVKMDYDRTRKTASLVRAVADKKSVKPGESVTLKVTLQPYRSKEITLDVPYKIPITAKEGAFVLDLHGGGLVPVTQAQQTGIITPSTKTPKQLYDEKIKQLLTANKNNEIIIKPAVMIKTEKELKAEVKRMKKLAEDLQKRGIKPTPAAPGKFATEYIIDNVIQCTLNVDKL